MIKRNIKMVVTSEESRQVQEICFANGIFWKSGSKQVGLEYKPYLFISNQYITYCDTAEFYNSNMNKEVDASVFIKTKGSCSEENQEQELNKNIKEEQMIDNEVETYKDVKEYLVAKGLYDRVMEIEWDYEVEEYEYFSDLYLWANTEEGVFYWDEIDEDLRDLGINMNIESLVQDYKAKQEEELKQNTNKEETMEKNEVKSYADVKEYLIAKKLYDRVMELDWDELDKQNEFSDLFSWGETIEGFDYWNEVDNALIKLRINRNIESLVQEYKAKQGKEFIQYLETQPEEVVEQTSEQSTETKPKQYLVFVPQKGKPKHIHQSLESAQEEAKRLCKSGLCEVMVLEVVSKYQAKVIVEEIK